MKRKTKWLIGLAIAVFAVAILWVNRQAFLASPATPEQRQYLPSLLADTSRVIIRHHPKVGGDVLGVVTSAADVADLVAATELTRVTPPCACFGFVSVDFIGTDGMTNSLNYKSDLGETYVKFRSEWNIQGIPSRRFRRLVRMHTGSANKTGGS
jgi:hypothetical protein